MERCRGGGALIPSEPLIRGIHTAILNLTIEVHVKNEI